MLQNMLYATKTPATLMWRWNPHEARNLQNSCLFETGLSVSENDPNNTKQKPWAINYHNYTQPAFTCPKLTIETLEQGVKYVQS